MHRAFTLIELLVVIAIISVLAAILFPVFASAKSAAKQSACLSNMRQISTGMQLYLADSEDKYPDRRDIKRSLTWRPWTAWPTSDPRSQWASIVLKPYLASEDIWQCPTVAGSVMAQTIQVTQGKANYWMWRFDQVDGTPLDNFWGKTPDQCVLDLIAAKNPNAGIPNGVAEVEILVDPYFPATIPSVDVSLRGLAAHAGGRNRLFADHHVKWLRDIRTNR